jgi:hypothetical protein
MTAAGASRRNLRRRLPYVTIQLAAPHPGRGISYIKEDPCARATPVQPFVHCF